ncbi:transcription factor E2F7-like [Lycorma delicatula]|uniref:transcription factor E2F7-like n=1 Tax=Lycorma delicatula TaxID=130591 RepID=UPI003F51530C
MDLEDSHLEADATPKRKILGDLSNGSPVSPMANLRLLTKVATSPVQAETSFTNTPCEKTNNQTANCVAALDKKNLVCGYVRRTKSLSVLCEKFLSLFPMDMENQRPRSISIKHIATDLGVEKRRVYDIVNIVECLDMARKFAKDSYIWYGSHNVPAKMASLNQYAIDIGFDKVVKEITAGQNVRLNMQSVNLLSLDERRIGVLCQKFIMLLLACHNKTPITLDMAAAVLIDGNESNKTKSRRLYDISNMLLALGIVKRFKPDGPNNPLKKPGFVYSGPCFDTKCNCMKCKRSSEYKVLSQKGQSAQTSVHFETDIFGVSDVSKSINIDTIPISFTPSKNKEPVAKKRLVFNSDMNIVFKPVTENVIHKQFDLKACKPLRSIIIQHPTIKLEPGSLYKAIKKTNSIRPVKDEHRMQLV